MAIVKCCRHCKFMDCDDVQQEDGSYEWVYHCTLINDDCILDNVYDGDDPQECVFLDSVEESS